MRPPDNHPTTAPRPERETHTLREACARLGVGKTLGYELARVGRFPVPVIRVGRRLLVSRAAVDRLLAASGGEATAAREPATRRSAGQAHGEDTDALPE